MIPFDLSPIGLGWMAITILVAGFVRGYSGFGFSALTIASSALVTNPLQFVAVVVLWETVMTLQALSGIWKDIDWRRVGLLLVGAMVGMPLGIWALTSISEDAARGVISAYVLTMSLILLAGWKLRGKVGPLANLGAGLVSGLANAPGMGGLPVAAFFAAQPMAPAVFRATVVAYFPILDVFSAPLYWMAGLVTWDTAFASAIVLPLTMLGNWLGGRHFFNSDPQEFRRFAIVLLAILALLGLAKAVI